MAKALTTKINELKRKIAQKNAAIVKHLAKARAHDKQNVNHGYWYSMAQSQSRELVYVKAELCDLLLEYVAQLEAENKMLSKEYEVQ